MKPKIYLYGTSGQYGNYLAALTEAGAEPVLSRDLFRACGCDGLLLPGGGDIGVTLEATDSFLIRSFADSGRIRILAISSDKRMRGLEQVPTFTEAGYKVEIANWRGILGSVDMPEENYQLWIDHFTKLSEAPQWKATQERLLKILNI